MNAHFEKVTPNDTSFHAFERVDNTFPFYWHYHPEFELTLILSSHGQRFVGGSIADYRNGDLVLLGPNIPHSWRSNPYAPAGGTCHRALVIQFKGDFLGEQFFGLNEMLPIAQLLKRSAYGLAFGGTEGGRKAAAKLESILDLPVPRRLLTLLSVLLDLADEPMAQSLLAERIRPMGRLADRRRLEAICSWLNEKFDEKIDYVALSHAVHMDQASLCRFFKRATGRTMTTYVNEIRLGAAAQLLTNTEQSVLDIGLRVGFENYSHFNRQFKRLKGCSPSVLRRKFLSGEAEANLSPPLRDAMNSRKSRATSSVEIH